MNKSYVDGRGGSLGRWLAVPAGFLALAGAIFARMAETAAVTDEVVEPAQTSTWIAGLGLVILLMFALQTARSRKAAEQRVLPDASKLRPVILSAADEVISIFGPMTQGPVDMEALDPPDEHKIDVDPAFQDVAVRFDHLERRQRKTLVEFADAVIEHNKQMDFLDRYKTIRGTFRIPKGMDKRLPVQVKRLHALALQVRELVRDGASSR